MNGRQHPPNESIPLSSLRPDLEAGWPLGTHWVADGEEEDKASSLEHPVGTTASFRLRHFSGSRLRGRVSLASFYGANPSGVVRAQVFLRAEGKIEKLWEGLAGGWGRLQRSATLDVELNSAAVKADLLLRASPLRTLRTAATRIRWQVPILELPSAGPPAPTPSSGCAIANGSAPSSRQGLPLISILTPVHNPPVRLLEETLESVRSQTYRNWELCLVNDGSSNRDVIAILEAAARDDPRVRLQRHPEARGISAATNTALTMATGPFIALLDHDDLLHPEALELVAAKLSERPDLDMVYSDEEMVEEERQVAVFRKPSWSPDLMRSHMYTCHLGVYRRHLAEEIGGFRSAFDGAQDYDFVLRLTERTDRIAHIPRILYKWRAHEASAAQNLTAKPHAYSAALRAIGDHLGRVESDASVRFGALRSWYRVEPRRSDVGPVALVLDAPELTLQLRSRVGDIGESWVREAAPAQQLVVVAAAATAEDWQRALHKSLGDRLRVVPVEPGIGKSARINRAVEASEARQLVLLATPLEALSTDALGMLASAAARPGIGAVAPKVLTPEGRVQSIGAILRDGLPVPVQLGADQIEQGPLAVLQVTANFGAVTGTVAMARDPYEQLEGLDDEFEEMAIADLCLRAWSKGMRVISAPEAILRRLPGVPPPVNDLEELLRFRKRWLPRLPVDPYYSGELATLLTGAVVAS